MGNKNIITNIYKIQEYNSKFFEQFCVEFIFFMLKGKSFLDDINFVCLNRYEKNDRIIPKVFLEILKRLRRKKYIILFVISIKHLKTLNIIYFR